MSCLVDRHCEPCRGGVPPLDTDAIVPLVRELADGWRVVDGHHLEKTYTFPDFRRAMAFAVRVGEVAEAEGHHPDIHLSWGSVRLEIWTYKAGGLTENDFILAARIEEGSTPDTAAYEAFLREIVKERDFTSFQPWRIGTAEHDLAWQHRVVDTAASRFGRDPQEAHKDVERALEVRRQENKKRYLARTPAVLAVLYAMGLKRKVTETVVMPLLRRKYVRSADSSSTSARAFDGLGTPRSPATRPKASIVVVSCNRLVYLRSTLESLYATANRDDYELIVVDNGSTDGSAEALRGLAERGAIDKVILFPENRGTSPAYNAGFACADPSTRHLIKLDSDITILDAGWLPRFEAFFERVPDAGVVAMTIVNHMALRLAPRQRVGGERVISWNYWISGGACMTIRRALFERLGYFREHDGVKYMPDDVDYAARVALLRLRSFYVCAARAYHREDRDRDYPALETQKQHELPKTREAMRAIRAEYVTGVRDLYVSYPRGRQDMFPEGRRILEMEK